MRGNSFTSGASSYEGLARPRALTSSRIGNASSRIETEDVRSVTTSRDGRKKSGGSSRSSTPAWDENADDGYSTSRTVASSVDQRRPRSRTRSANSREKSKPLPQNAATSDGEHQARSYYAAVSRRLSCSSGSKERTEEDHVSRRTTFVPVFATSSSPERVEDRTGASIATTAADNSKDAKLYRRPSWSRSSKKEHTPEESVSRLSKRASRLGLPELEKDLLPSLNDTVERMTHGVSRRDSRSDQSSLERMGSREKHRLGWNAIQHENRFSPAARGFSPVTPQQSMLTPEVHQSPRMSAGPSNSRSPRLTPSSGIPKPKSILKSTLRASVHPERVSFEDDGNYVIQTSQKVSSRSRQKAHPTSSTNVLGTSVASNEQYSARSANASSKLPRDSLQVTSSTPSHGRNSPRIPMPSPKWNSSPTPRLDSDSYFTTHPLRDNQIQPESLQDMSDAASLQSADTMESAISEDTTSADERYLAAEQVINAAGRLSPLAMNMSDAYRRSRDDGSFTSSTPRRVIVHKTLNRDLDDSEGSDYDTEASLDKDSGDSRIRRRQELVDLVSGMTSEEKVSTKGRNSGSGFSSLRRHRLSINTRTPERSARTIDSDGASEGDSTPCLGIAIGGSTPTTCSTDGSMRSMFPMRLNTSIEQTRYRERGAEDPSMLRRVNDEEHMPLPDENRDSVLLLNADLQREAFGIPPSSSSLGGSCSGYSSAESSLSLQNAAMDSEPDDEVRRGLGLSFGAEKLFQSLSLGGTVSSMATKSKRYQEFEERVDRHSRQQSKALSQNGRFTESTRNSTESPGPGSHSKRRSQQRGRKQQREPSSTSNETAQRIWHRDDLIDQYGELEIRRQEVIQELCDSERSFVATLGTALEVYVHPLLDENRRWMAGVPSLAANVLDWLDDIYQLHAQICSTLDHIQSTQYPIVTSIATPLRHFVARLEVYQPYICRLDEAVELIEDATIDPNNDFGEFLRLQKTGIHPIESDLTSSLWLPLTRLSHYLDLFNTLWTLTSRHHPDYLSTYSLLTSVTLVVRVLREVKLREDEYSFVKGLASRIRGLRCLDDVVKRERRLRAHGPLYLFPSSEQMDDGSNSPNQNTTNGRARDRFDTRKPQRRAASLDSGLSAASSLSSIASSASSTCLNSSDIHPPRRDANQQSSPSHSKIYAFVFDDLVLITRQSRRNNVDDEDVWELASDMGICRVLSIDRCQDIHRAFCLHLFPVEQPSLGAGFPSDSRSLYASMRVPTVRRDRSDISNTGSPHEEQTFDLWWRAFQRCCFLSIRSLSVPSFQGSYLSDEPGSITRNASDEHTLMSLVSSGLPMPKSPSLQLAGPQSTRTSAEREERGWWSSRFHEVLRDIRRRDASFLSEQGF